MEDKIQSFRQPLVTASGIILGFLLNFASTFVKTETETSDFSAYVVGICILIGIIFLIIALARILKMNYPKDTAEKFYRKTLFYFILGVCVSFFGVLIDMFTNFMTD